MAAARLTAPLTLRHGDAASPRRRAAVLALAGGLLLAGCDRAAVPAGAGASGQRPAFKAVDITGATYAGKFSLPDADGQVRTLADFKGKVVVVFFGYTQCPDVCPTTMTELAEVKRTLGDAGRDVVGIFVTVDPERDQPALLKSYLANFGPDMVGLRGSPDQVREVAKEFKVFYSKVPGKTDTSYTVDHTAGSYVFDRQGRVRLFTRYGSGAKNLVDDLRILLDQKG